MQQQYTHILKEEPEELKVLNINYENVEYFKTGIFVR
jgi:hypothetical protein